MNTFRYRDEYFVLSNSDAEAGQHERGRHGLVGRQVDSPIELDRVARRRLEAAWAKRAEEVGDPDEVGTLNEVLAPFGSGWLVAEFDCLTVAEQMNRCHTDHFKLQFEVDPDRSVNRFFELCTTGAILTPSTPVTPGGWVRVQDSRQRGRACCRRRARICSGRHQPWNRRAGALRIAACSSAATDSSECRPGMAGHTLRKDRGRHPAAERAVC